MGYGVLEREGEHESKWGAGAMEVRRMGID
jgi:hypothetical protein